MVSARPEKEMEEMTGKTEEEYSIVSEVERLLKDLLKYKDTLLGSMEAINTRLDEIEKRPTTKAPKDIQLQIEKIEETIEKLSKGDKQPTDDKTKEEIEAIKTTIVDMNNQLDTFSKIGESVTEISEILGEIEKKIDNFSKTDIESERKLTEIKKIAEEAKKLSTEDNKFLESSYNEMKEQNIVTDEKLREMSKEIAKIKKESEKSANIKKLLTELIKEAMS